MDPDEASRECVLRALAEDLGGTVDAAADRTGRLAVAAGRPGRARVTARAAGIVAGLACARLAFELLDGGCTVQTACRDGDSASAGTAVLTVSGPLRVLLAAERTALNFLQRLSGIATLTRAFVDAVAGTGAVVLDTRKTTPGLRILEKQAVLAGGGHNHRFGLFDQVLLKENHFAAAGAPVEDVVRRCVAGQSAPVVAEARTVEDAVAAVRGGAAVVLLDNFPAGPQLVDAVHAVRTAAAETGRTVAIEASGGIRLDNVRAYAACGVDRLSVGALTHSAPALDLSMLVEASW